MHGLGPEGWRRLLVEGRPVEPSLLADSRWRGVSLGLPPWLERATWTTFRKVFQEDASSGTLRGWNVRVHQDGVEAPTRARERRGRPWRFGHYVVVPSDGRGCPLPLVAGTVLLDYGRGANPAFDPTRLVRDPLVALRQDGTLLLGWTYLELGAWRISTPSWFTLEREGALEHGA